MRYFYDLETNGLAGKFVFGGVIDDNNNYFEYDRIKKFLDYLEKTGDKENDVFAHNGGGYDHRYILDYIKNKSKYRWTKMIVINSHVFFRLYIDKKHFDFKDTFLLMPHSLSILTKEYGVRHIKKEFDIEAWMSAGCPITEELKKYCKYDVVGLKEVFMVFENQINSINNNNKLRLTIASTSFGFLLDTPYNNKTIRTVTKNYFTKEQENFIRRAYKGGRTEVFKRVGHNLNYYDVNSLYPHVMTFDYPIGNSMIVTDRKLLNIMLKKGVMGVVECSIVTIHNTLKGLEWRYKK